MQLKRTTLMYVLGLPIPSSLFLSLSLYFPPSLSFFLPLLSLLCFLPSSLPPHSPSDCYTKSSLLVKTVLHFALNSITLMKCPFFYAIQRHKEKSKRSLQILHLVLRVLGATFEWSSQLVQQGNWRDNLLVMD